MAVRFKFRSSVNFDSVDIDGRPSISVSDLKSKILHNKNLSICQDFDLVFSDAVTGQEFRDENFQIPSGSSVIIKRVPAGSARSDIFHVELFGKVGITDTTNTVKTSPPTNRKEIENFDDFGVELCPVPEETICGSVLDVNQKIHFTGEKKNDEDQRSLKMALLGCQKLEASDLSEAIPRGPLHTGDEDKTSWTKSKLNVQEYAELEKVDNANPQAMENSDLPSELKCSLCDTFFKEAVMIPCCQHSFCQKCIHLVLVSKGRCPKCLSTRCKVEDLLPNVSLRQAIDRFLQSQILMKGSDNAVDRYAPDGESGIQAKEMSYAPTFRQREAELPHSSSATGRGSNQIISEPVGGKSVSLSHKLKQIDGVRHVSTHRVDFKELHKDMVADFQGESQPMHEEAESTMKKKALWVNTKGVDRSSMETGRPKKMDRTCYMCGSPDHFIRDCPAASSPHPMLQSGHAMFPASMPSYVPPHWSGSPFPQIRPFLGPFGNPGIMPFNAPMVPTTFAVPSYMPSMYGSMAAYRGLTRMVGVAPVGTGAAEWHLGHSECGLHQGCDKRQKLSNENLRREQLFDDDGDESFNKKRHYNEAERSRDRKSHRDMEETVSYSEDSFTQRSHRKHRQYDHLDDDPERSNSEIEDMPSSSNRHSEERHKHHHRKSKKHGGRREQCGSDSSWSHHLGSKEKDFKRKRDRSDVKSNKRKHNSQSESRLEPSLSGAQKTQRKERDFSHGSRHSRHNSRTMDDEPSRERWKMIGGSDEDEDYHYHRRKRVY